MECQRVARFGSAATFPRTKAIGAPGAELGERHAIRHAAADVANSVLSRSTLHLLAAAAAGDRADRGNPEPVRHDR